jgi:hypothetical protein
MIMVSIMVLTMITLILGAVFKRFLVTSLYKEMKTLVKAVLELFIKATISPKIE